MKRMGVFLLVVFFSLLFIASYTSWVQGWRYGKGVNIAAQAGLGISLILFFITRARTMEERKRRAKERSKNS